MRLRLALFDLWGTLIRDVPEIGERRRLLRAKNATETLAALGHRYDLADVERAFDVAGEALGRVHADGRDLSTEGRTVLYLQHLDETLPDRLDEAGWPRMHEAVLTAARSATPPVIDGAHDSLKDMKALGLQVGLISNAGITPGFVLREVLQLHGLLVYFNETVFSDEVELSKPNAAIFEHTLELFGVHAGEAVFIGDQPVLDVLGPRAAGLWSVQVGDLSEAGIEPHARIAEVRDLLPALRDLGLV